ncbi:MAG TPA: DUF4249 family protein [Longimicrobium sp.]|jgi:hypothetical protein|uniref:DUF4249 family protein n=1 Tax=Longimicrobium sp. TaxID=2029185 RepID=UPI002EDA6015
MAAVFALAALGACTIADVTEAGGDDVLVVEAVLRTDRPEQRILLHRSVRGALSPGEPGAEVFVTGNGGARYRFEMVNSSQCITVDPLYANADSVDLQASCYRSLGSYGYWVNPDSVYDLTVVTTRGETARGRTHVPAPYAILQFPYRSRLRDGPRECTVPGNTPLPIVWTQSRGAYGYLAPLRITGLDRVAPDSISAPAELELTGLAVSSSDTTLVLPTDFGIFDRFSLDQRLLRYLRTGLPPGVRADVVIAAADRNYINGVRGGSFNPSGQVRISSVVGDGRGVFGSLVPLYLSFNLGQPNAQIACNA